MNKKGEELIYFEHKQSLNNTVFFSPRIFGLLGLSVVLITVYVLRYWDASEPTIPRAMDIIIGVLFVLIAVIFFRRRNDSKQSNDTSDDLWHIQLSENKLLWHAPQHDFGTEQSFEVSIKDISKIERICIMGSDSLHQVDYFLHTKTSPPIQLRGFSGIALDKLCEAIEKNGIQFHQRYI